MRRRQTAQKKRFIQHQGLAATCIQSQLRGWWVRRPGGRVGELQRRRAFQLMFCDVSHGYQLRHCPPLSSSRGAIPGPPSRDGPLSLSSLLGPSPSAQRQFGRMIGWHERHMWGLTRRVDAVEPLTKQAKQLPRPSSAPHTTPAANRAATDHMAAAYLGFATAAGTHANEQVISIPADCGVGSHSCATSSGVDAGLGLGAAETAGMVGRPDNTGIASFVDGDERANVVVVDNDDDDGVDANKTTKEVPLLMTKQEEGQLAEAQSLLLDTIYTKRELRQAFAYVDKDGDRCVS